MGGIAAGGLPRRLARPANDLRLDAKFAHFEGGFPAGRTLPFATLSRNGLLDSTNWTLEDNFPLAAIFPGLMRAPELT